MGYLCLKQAFAIATGETEKAAIAADAAKSFLADHLSYVAQPLAASLIQSGIGYMAKSGEMLLARVGPTRSLPVIQSLPQEVCGIDSTFDCGLT